MFEYIAMGIAADVAGIATSLYLKKKKDEKAEAELRHFEENLDRIAAECNPFNDEKFDAEFQESLRKCADKNMANLHATMEKLYMA